MKNIIIVPAKGDSKRFPRKNWMELGGDTLFELALFRAKKSGLGKVVFASDSMPMIDKVEKRVFLSDYVCLLPGEFSEKRAVNACVYVLEKFKRDGIKFDNIIVTLPTSPLANENHLQEAYEKFVDYNMKTVASFTPVEGRPLLWEHEKIGISEFMKPLLDENAKPKKVYRDNGAVYISTVERFLKEKEWFDRYVVPYFMNEVEGIDIDTELDYLMVKTIYETKEMAG